MTPQRIQRRRTKGWRMPDGAVYVGRPTKWGNPFTVGRPIYQNNPLFKHAAAFVRHGYLQNVVNLDSLPLVVSAYRHWLTSSTDDDAVFLRSELKQRALTGRDLVCWCPAGQPCHADVLLELANQ